MEDLVQRVAPFLVEAGLIEPDWADPGNPKYPLAPRGGATAQGPDQDPGRGAGPDELLPARRAAALRSGPAGRRRRPSRRRSGPRCEAVADLLRDDRSRPISKRTEAALRALAEQLGLKAGQLFMPIRVAVTGRTESPGLFETLRAIGHRARPPPDRNAIALLRRVIGGRHASSRSPDRLIGTAVHLAGSSGRGNGRHAGRRRIEWAHPEWFADPDWIADHLDDPAVRSSP